jgi:hypothetical protein
MKFWSNSDIPSHGTFVPEKRLLAAVLQRAITDFITGDGELKEGARLWLLEDESCSDAPLSFRFICEALDLDLQGLKKAIFIQESAQVAATAATIRASTPRMVSNKTVVADSGRVLAATSSTGTVISPIAPRVGPSTHVMGTSRTISEFVAQDAPAIH